LTPDARRRTRTSPAPGLGVSISATRNTSRAGDEGGALRLDLRPGRQGQQIENDYDKEVYNGDIGYVEGVDADEGELTASFDGRTVSYAFGELDTLVPAYAATIHKSQGSEYPAVVIPMLTQHYAMLQRNLLYTGVTRGKRLVVLVGQPKAVAIAVKNASGRRRWSKLDEWLTPKRT
jgi:exodeoxyribonuclease V alpha subunit